MTRGFAPEEFAQRIQRAQNMMAKTGLAALLLTTEPEIRYFSGFLTRFWESPTRPWFLVLPAAGAPIAVIPTIGADLMARNGVRDIRTWSSPDLQDDGVSLLAQTLNEVAGTGQIGVPDGPETLLRMPLADYRRLVTLLEGNVVGDHAIMRRLRMVKSSAEIEKIGEICQIAGRAFDRVGEIAAPGVPLSGVFRAFQRLGLEEGADWVPYLAGAAAPIGYGDVISPADDTPLRAGDVLMLDTGMVRDGYFCDFNRNFAIGAVDSAVAQAHERLMEAVDAAAQIARPGATAAQLFHAMDAIVGKGGEPGGGAQAGRLGHGLGMQLTEWPSLIPSDHTCLEPGMVLTLEPSIATAGGLMVHEENIVITAQGCAFLSPRAGRKLVVI